MISGGHETTLHRTSESFVKIIKAFYLFDAGAITSDQGLAQMTWINPFNVEVLK